MAQNLLVVLPELTLALMAAVVLLIDVFSENEEPARQTSALSLVSVVLTVGVCLFLWGKNLAGFSGTVQLDSYGLFLSVVCLLATGAVILLSSDSIPHLGKHAGDYFVLLLLSTVGMMVMVKATDLLTIFIGLETLSIPLYVLAGYRKDEPTSTEASLKYFLMGAFASGFLLYGIALTYAALGSTHLEVLRQTLLQLPAKDNSLLVAGMSLMLVGFGFKLALVPFHMWAPDVYEGSPTPVTAFMSGGVKVAAAGALLRVLGGAFLPVQGTWAMALWILAAFSITFGNILALTQDNLKRMLAYSSVAHVGYLLIGLIAYQPTTGSFGAWSVIFYLTSYVVMSIGAFGVLILVQPREHGAERLRDMAGLARTSPWVALCMTIFLLSLGGMPPLWGFAAKFYVFGAALKREMYALVVLAVIGSLISMFYYLRVIVEMYMAPSPETEQPISRSLALRAVVGTAALLTLLGGLFPSTMVELAQQAFASLLGR